MFKELGKMTVAEIEAKIKEFSIAGKVHDSYFIKKVKALKFELETR